MARFPYSYGSLEITKYPKAQYLNVTLPDGNVYPCIVLPTSDKWMRLYADKNGGVHAEVSINIDDATGLNNWAKAEALKQGKNHTDFHGQIHLTPGKDARKAWQQQLEDKYLSMDNMEFDAEAKKLKLDQQSIVNSDYYRQHPDKVPTHEQVAVRLAQNEMQRLTAAGRIYSTELNETTPVASGTATATAATLPMPTLAEREASEKTQQYAGILGAQPADDDLPF